ncbi:MAG: SUF system NifU family Fe-S cluster assembly protein [Spirochaetales bacterium]|nr:SUF system NifU family Fe-S cluster assembly protein [Spirochaetales bacterium]
MFDDLYQEIILDHYKNPRNSKDLSQRNIPFLDNPVCGDSVRVAVDWTGDDRIERVWFEGQGCAISTASASLMTELFTGKTVEEAEDLCRRFTEIMRGEREEDLADWGELEALQGVVNYPARVKCATLPWHSLEKALERHRLGERDRNEKGA